MFVFNCYFNNVWIGAVRCESFAVAQAKVDARWPDRIGKIKIRMSM